MALIKPEQLRSGSYNITGSLFGTSSYANFALTASFALNGGGGSPFPYTGSARITGSLSVTGSVKATTGFTGSLQGTATNAAFADNANYASTAGQAALADEPTSDWVPRKPDPSGLSPYNLGSETSWWNKLYIGHGTIYFMSQSVGGPTVSSSISVVDDTHGSSFVFNTKNAAGQPTNIIISNEGVSTAISASYALTASYAMNSSVVSTPFRISTGSISASVNIGSTIFLITNNNVPVLTVSQSGIVILATQSIDPTGTAPNGAIYFTSSSFFLGLD
jgi:hypothetical protein